HGGGKNVVRRLTAVDVVVRMNEAPLAALAAQKLAGAVGENLVDVHVGLGSTSRLPNDEGKFVVVLAGQHLVGRLDDGPSLFHVEGAEVEVDERGGLFHQSEGVDQLARHSLARDLEIGERALRLRAPQLVGRYLDG